MCTNDEIWILLRDPHELDQVDGAWGAGIARLASEALVAQTTSRNSTPDARNTRIGSGPLVLTEAPIARCVRRVDPRIPLLAVSATELPADVPRPVFDRSALRELMLERARLPEPARWKRIRSYGLESAILGFVLSQTLGIPHTASFAEPFDAEIPDPRLWRIRDRVRRIEEMVAERVDAIETPDEGRAGQLRDIVSPRLSGRITVMCLAPPSFARRAGSEPRVFRIAVEASTRRPVPNRTVLRAIRSLRDACANGSTDLLFHWIAPRSGYPAGRARRDIRRWGLAGILRWEDEPWIDPPHTREERWDLLVRPDPAPGARPLHAAVRARGIPVLAPGPGRTFGVDELRSALESLVSRRRSPAEQGHEAGGWSRGGE
jgi:hypothetical protein